MAQQIKAGWTSMALLLSVAVRTLTRGRDPTWCTLLAQPPSFTPCHTLKAVFSPPDAPPRPAPACRQETNQP